MESKTGKANAKAPENMSTDELIQLADEIKGDITTEWLKRRKAQAVTAKVA